MKISLQVIRVFLALAFLSACGSKPMQAPTLMPTLLPTQSETPTTPPIPTNTIAATATVAPKNIATATTKAPDCTNGWSRLNINSYARVTGKEGDPPNRVRSGPGKANEIIAQIYPQTVVKVVEGPVCADGLVFWEIESSVIANGNGWTAEGNGKEYYVEPYVSFADGVLHSDLGVSLMLPREWDSRPYFRIYPSYSTVGSKYPYPLYDRPESILVTMTSYPISSLYNPSIQVFQESSYAGLNPETKQALTLIDQYIAGNTDIGDITPLPPMKEKLLLQSHIKIIDVPNGRGIRVIQTRRQGNRIYPPFFEPIVNQDLFYLFMGFTNDGKDYVVAILPVSSPLLCDDYTLHDDFSMTCDLPPDGIPFENFPNESDWQQYYSQVTGQLNAADDIMFSPSLDQLDTIVQSILVTRP